MPGNVKEEARGVEVGGEGGRRGGRGSTWQMGRQQRVPVGRGRAGGVRSWGCAAVDGGGGI